MRDIWGKIAYTSGARIYSLLSGILILFITARLLGPKGRGQVAAIVAWVGMFCTFLHLSLGQVALHRMAGDPEHLRFGKLLASLITLMGLFTIVGWLAALGLYWYNPDGVFKGLSFPFLLVGFLSLPFLIWEQYGGSLLMGLDQVRIYNRNQVIGRTISLIAVIVLLGWFGAGVIGVLEANLLGQIIVALGGVGFLLSYAKNSGFAFQLDNKETMSLLAGGAKLHLNAVGTFLFTTANVIILNHYHGAEQTGYFQLAMQLLNVMMIIPQAASMVIYGKVTSIGPDAAWPYNKRLLLQIALGMIVLIIISSFLAPWGITLLAGDAFQPAVEPFQWMLLGLIGMTFSAVMAPQWIGRGYFWQAAGLTFLIGIINLSANFYLIPQYGMQGAVYAFLGTYIFSILGNGMMALHAERKYKLSL